MADDGKGRYRRAHERAETRQVIRLAFGGRPEKFDEFVETVARPSRRHVRRLAGQRRDGERWKDGAVFDADGPGTSDLDLTLVGGDEVDRALQGHRILGAGLSTHVR